MADYTKEWRDVLQKRNNKLTASDWTQAADSPLSNSKKLNGLRTDKLYEIYLIIYVVILTM